MASTPEKKVKAAVGGTLERARAWYFKPVSNGMGRHGIPDIIACVPYVVQPEDIGKTIGRFVAVETKAPGKLSTVTPLQRNELRRIEEADGIAVVADDAELVEQALSGIGFGLGGLTK